ncbi:hypothetical protein K7432_003658 [Basidiobolus ranarum]|uniref:G-protein coupled receptors family 1 profile domain-containing protein n=1 Tax=Basidiobolus ranarum TaxID=34480 RepID=A0ABR2WZG4_9FUNG
MSSLTIQIITLSGSILSMVGSGLMIICCILLPITGTFRHQLICSLAISDFIYSLNNSISGLLLVTNGSLNDGVFCTVNGYVHHYSSLIRDLTVLGIALVTYGVLKGPLDSADYEPYLPRHRIIVFLFIWLAPNIPTLIGYKSSGFTLVSGNWCSAPSDPMWVRAVLFLGIPFLITISIVILYAYLYGSLRLYYISTRQLDTGYFDTRGDQVQKSSSGNHDAYWPSDDINEEKTSVVLTSSIKDNIEELAVINITTKELSIHLEEDLVDTCFSHNRTNDNKVKPEFSTADNDHIAMAMRRIYLYPLVYVVITLPGLLNRLLETSGVDLNIFEILQSITQLTGLANAVLYGFTGTVRRAFYDQYLRS